VTTIKLHYKYVGIAVLSKITSSPTFPADPFAQRSCQLFKRLETRRIAPLSDAPPSLE
jgi:hypothetical protein